MSVPTIQVLVGFEQTTGFATPFQLDSATYGLLGTSTLGGIQMVDVTEMVQSISITRGRNRNTEAFNAGTAQVTFHDPDRQLDPLNASSPYYPYVEPRQPPRFMPTVAASTRARSPTGILTTTTPKTATPSPLPVRTLSPFWRR